MQVTASASIIVSWCLVLLATSCYSSGLSVLKKSTTPLNKRWKIISKLRTVGRSNIQAQRYQQASYCYSAVLQIVEGAFETKYVNVRRHCGMLLGRCEELLGNAHHAIARCSEVINEAPDIEPIHELGSIYVSKQQIDDDLHPCVDAAASDVGEAYYCRARCLRTINEPMLALVDLHEALKYLPDENGIYEEIAQIEQELAQERPPEKQPPTLITPNDTASTDIAPHDQQTADNVSSCSPPTSTIAITDNQSEERRIDFLEHCLLNYPSLVFSKKQVRALCSLARRLDRLSLPPSAVSSAIATAAGARSSVGSRGADSQMMSQDLMSKLTAGLGHGMGGGGGGSGDIGGPAAGLMSLLAPQLQGKNGMMNGNSNIMNNMKGMNVETLISMLPLLASFAGLSADATRNISEILRALAGAYKLLSKMWKKVAKHRDLVVIALSMLWVVVTAACAYKDFSVR